MKIKLIVWLLFIFSSFAYGQNVSNQALLNTLGEEKLKRIWEYLRLEPENQWVGYNERIKYSFVLLPTVYLKNQAHYTFNESFRDYIDFERIDTVAHFFVLDGQGTLIAHINRLNSDFYMTPPLFKSDKRYRLLMTGLNTDDAFVFRLPCFAYEWWVLKNDVLYVFMNHRLIQADKYIRKNYKERFFINLINESL